MISRAGVSNKRLASIALFRRAVLVPFFALLLFMLPVFLLQIYFSFHSWTIYLTNWWEAEFVGFETFREVLTDARFLGSFVRSFVFAGFSTLGGFIVGFGLALLMYRPFKGHGFFYT